MDQPVVIVAASRSPIGSFCGSLSSMKAHDISSVIIKDILQKCAINPAEISEVIMGQALTAGQGQNPARQAAMKADIPFTVPAYLVNQLCGSGLKSVILGYQSIKCNDAKLVVCGGQESMSQVPHCIHMRGGLKMGNATLIDSLVFDGLTDAFENIHMGMTAENIAKKYNISRDEQDEFAIKSQRKAEEAQINGHFSKEIVPISVTGKRGTSMTLSEDEYPRHGVTHQNLKKLSPAFSEIGTVTAGNASGINDGAAIVVLASLKQAQINNLKPLAKIVGYAEAGVEPDLMGLGPIPAIRTLLNKCGWRIENVDLFEINEAFAAQTLAVVKDLHIDMKKVNISGGAIALGHPIGASGARILVTLLHNLVRTNTTRGIAALCIGGGMGIAIAVERR